MLDVDQPQPESYSMLDVDQDRAEPMSKTLQDFIDGNRSKQDVIKEIIEETNELTIEDFLTDLTNFSTECQQSEVQSCLMDLLAEIQKSANVAKVDIKEQFNGLLTELLDWYNCMFYICVLLTCG